MEGLGLTAIQVLAVADLGIPVRGFVWGHTTAPIGAQSATHEGWSMGSCHLGINFLVSCIGKHLFPGGSFRQYAASEHSVEHTAGRTMLYNILWSKA